MVGNCVFCGSGVIGGGVSKCIQGGFKVQKQYNYVKQLRLGSDKNQQFWVILIK